MRPGSTIAARPRADVTPPTVEIGDALNELEPVWRDLAARSDNLFASWEWLETWWRHFGRGRPLLLVTVRDATGAPVAIWPMYVASFGPARVLRLLGHGPTDQLGPVCHPDDRATAAEALRRVLDDPPVALDVLIADELPGGLDWADALGGRVLAQQAYPTVTLQGHDWASWSASRSSGLRSQLRRGTRRLAAHGSVRYRETTSVDELGDDLETLWHLHDARWAAVGGSRAFARRTAFHREVAAIALRRGWLRLRLVEVDGRPVGALYNLRFGEAEYFYQAGRDPSVDDASVGLLLHAHAIEACLDDGLVEYRMLRGAEPYKRRLADADPGSCSVARPMTAKGTALLEAVGRMDGWPRWAQRRVPAPLAWGTGGAPVWGAL